MRRHRRSHLSSFMYGILIASGTAGGLMATHHLLAPPSPDMETATTEAGAAPQSTLIGLLPGVERWARQSAPSVEALPAPAPPVTAQVWPTEVVATSPPAAPKKTAVPSKPTGEAHRVLTRNIQRELKRVGCYAGDIDGEWSPATRTAMKSFNDTVRVPFPVAAPDYILLTLLQGQTSLACIKPDPSITASVPQPKTATKPQSADPLPPRATAVITPRLQQKQVAQPTQPAAVEVIATTPMAVPTAAPIPGRMAIGAPPARIEPQAPALPPAERTAATPPEREIDQPAPQLVPRTPPSDRRGAVPSRQGNPGAPQRQVARTKQQSPGLFTSLSRNAP